MDRLKSVKVSSEGRDTQISNVNDEDFHKNLPKEKIGAEYPYVFFKPKSVPFGKITILDSLEMLINHKKDNVPIPELAKQYSIHEKDVELIIKYVDIFNAIDDERREVPLYMQKEEVVPKIES